MDQLVKQSFEHRIYCCHSSASKRDCEHTSQTTLVLLYLILDIVLPVE